METREKKALIIVSIVGFVASFELENVRLLREAGYAVHVAGAFFGTREGELEMIGQAGAQVHLIDMARNPFRPKNIAAYRRLKALIEGERFDLVHCHTPVGGLLGRLAAYRAKTKRVMYTAHGFHFYKGAPFLNRLLYYPAEWLFSFLTDDLVTIAGEDYLRAKRDFHAKRTWYVPGVGIIPEDFAPDTRARDRMRRALGVADDDIMVLSVGELNDNKNHLSAVQAMLRADNTHLKYFIAGDGALYTALDHTIASRQAAGSIRLLGYRKDVPDLMRAADIYLLPSRREGLNVSLMEAMAAGLPCVCADIRGNRDLIRAGKGGYYADVTDPADILRAVTRLSEDVLFRKQASDFNRERAKRFSADEVKRRMRRVYAASSEKEEHTKW